MEKKLEVMAECFLRAFLVCRAVEGRLGGQADAQLKEPAGDSHR